MQNQISLIIKKVFEEFLLKDKFLLKHDVSEWAIAHRFAVYLEKYFPEFHIDCEYNRDGLGGFPKRLKTLKEFAKEKKLKGARVYPDIIVHRRGEKEGFLAIEFSKSNKSTAKVDFDIKKLNAYKNELGYKHAYLITIPIKKDIKKIRSIDELIKKI